MKLSLKAARINSGLTQKCVAKRLNVNVSTISNWEQGKTYPTANKLAQNYSAITNIRAGEVKICTP